MATGKTVTKHIKVEMDDSNPTLRDISASVDSISQVGIEYDSPEATAYSDGWKNMLVGLPGGDIELGGPFNNTASTGAHAVFTSIAGVMTATYTLTVSIGIRAASTTGDPKWSGEYYCKSYTVIPGGPSDVVKWKAVLVPASTTAGTWGTV